MSQFINSYQALGHELFQVYKPCPYIDLKLWESLENRYLPIHQHLPRLTSEPKSNIYDVDSFPPLLHNKIERNVVTIISQQILTDEQLAQQGFPVQSVKGVTFFWNSRIGMDKDSLKQREHTLITQRKCCRCHNEIWICSKTGSPLNQHKSCRYHWGKLRFNWDCCNRSRLEEGCETAPNHVWTNILSGVNGPFYDFKRTEAPNAFSLKQDNNNAVLSMDCEMVFTQNGMELAKVSLVDLNCEVVYESLVRPVAPVIDYNTRYSGLRQEDFDGREKSFAEVQADILRLVKSNTVLIGHSLENDLRALKIVHTNVVDTCVMYPHHRGAPLRRSLKDIAFKELKKAIQQGEHDSREDAITVVELVLHKIVRDLV